MRVLLTRMVLMMPLAGLWGEWSYSQPTTDVARPPVVVELFTSEGCSSCPPADRLLESLDKKQPFADADLVVLSEHVDYWNHDGWVDPYSSHSFSERQLSYAAQFGLDDVYTPQAVVDGRRQIVGSDAVGIQKAVEAVAGNEKVPVTLSNPVRDGQQLKLRLTLGRLKEDGPATVYVALADNRVQTNVGGGENRGRSLTHVAVVRVLLQVATVKAGESLSKEITIPVPARLSGNGIRMIVFLQAEKSHDILGAGRILLPS